VDDELLELGPHGRFPVVEANGLSHVPIARLGSMLGAGSYDELMAATDIRQAASGGAVVFRFPGSIRDALTAPERLDEVAPAWAAIEEMTASGWTLHLTEGLLDRLGELARDAQSAERELWYWWSL
jgi:hypothetical protein